MFYELSRLAISNLLRARARLLMTAGGVLVGTTAVILLIALTIGLQNAAETGIGQSGTLTEIEVWPNYGGRFGPGGGGGGGSPEEVPQLTVENVNRFWRIPGVQAVIPMASLQGGTELFVDDFQGWAQVMGVNAQLLPYLNFQATQGQVSLGPGQVLVGAEVARNFYDPDADPDEGFQPIEVDLFNAPEVELRVMSWDGSNRQRTIELQIAGVLAPQGGRFDYSIIMPMDEAIALNEFIMDQEVDPETFTFDSVTVRATDRETTNEVTEAIREMGFNTGGLGEYLNQLNQFFGTMRLALGGVGGVALLVAAFGVANTMTMAILERTKEIGLMKAIGATDRDVLTIFLVEAGLVGSVGGAAGIGVSLLLQNLVNETIRNLPQGGDGGGGPGFMFLPIAPGQGDLFVIPPDLMLFALALATLVGVFAGLYPAWRAAKLSPVIALKTE